MSEDGQETRGLIDVNALPEPVRRMAEVMAGLDAEWTIDGWLTQQAEQTLALLRHDLKRERLLLEQRKFRLDDLKAELLRMEPTRMSIKCPSLIALDWTKTTRLLDCLSGANSNESRKVKRMVLKRSLNFFQTIT